MQKWPFFYHFPILVAQIQNQNAHCILFSLSLLYHASSTKHKLHFVFSQEQNALTIVTHAHHLRLIHETRMRDAFSLSHTEVKSRTGGSYFAVQWTWQGQAQRKTPGLHLDYTERMKILVQWQSISWNNETSLLIKSEFIHDYNHGSPLMYSLLWSMFPVQSLITYNRISHISMISCKDSRNTWVPLECLNMSQP